MKAELYSFLLENKFKNGVMYIKSMHEFVVKYDMAESVEEESLMRGFQRWRKKMKKELYIIDEKLKNDQMSLKKIVHCDIVSTVEQRS